MFSPLVALAALVLLAIVLQDAFEVMLLPRRVYRRRRLARTFFRTSWTAWAWLARRLPEGERRIRFLVIFGPLSLIALFALWATMLITGFALLDWAVQSRHHPYGLNSEAYLSGVTFFTTGYGDVAPNNAVTRVLAVIESGIGLGFIAVVIGYLPVLYQLFARREAHVIQLDARAGSPPTGSTMLVLHAEMDSLQQLNELLREWEVWGAELLESHLSYPMLVYYRSQHDDQSWLAAMTAVMDACALVLVGAEDMQPLQARMTFTMIRQVVVEMSRALAVAPSVDSGEDRLSHADYKQMLAAFADAGLAWKGGPDAEEVLHALRATYEPLINGLARRLLLSLPPWMPAENAVDHWQGGHRGLIASRLVAQLSRGDTANTEHKPGSRGLRDRLRR